MGGSDVMGDLQITNGGVNTKSWSSRLDPLDFGNNYKGCFKHQQWDLMEFRRIYPESTNHVWYMYIYVEPKTWLWKTTFLFIMAIAKASMWNLGETSGTKWQPQRQAQRQYPQRWWEDVTVTRYIFSYVAKCAKPWKFNKIMVENQFRQLETKTQACSECSSYWDAPSKSRCTHRKIPLPITTCFFPTCNWYGSKWWRSKTKQH